MRTLLLKRRRRSIDLEPSTLAELLGNQLRSEAYTVQAVAAVEREPVGYVPHHRGVYDLAVDRDKQQALLGLKVAAWFRHYERRMMPLGPPPAGVPERRGRHQAAGVVLVDEPDRLVAS
jgi:hypothetical protein